MQTIQLNNVQQLLTQHMAIWTSAETEKKSGRGRASGNAGSVYGIKKLRELILELAVRGKLVPQDANDEPASELLKRIQVEKTKLVAEGKLKKEKPLSPISENEKPFELPKCWEWTYFSDIAQHNSGKTLDTGRNKGLLRDYITTSNLYWGSFELDSVKQMPIEESELVRCTASKGDLLICEGGEAGRAAVWIFDKEVCFQNHIHRARFFGHISPFYAYRYFEKLNSSGEIELYRKGVGISNMSGKALASVIFALPPLSEQQRIVAKVDALMALCDQLESQHNSAAEAHETLVSELLDTLTHSQDAAEFQINWQRIAEHFDVLFTTEASIDALKQTLLQLAVMGKLVPQDPNDEPASELLKRIQAEKAKLITEGKLKKEKPLATISEGEMPFDLPQGWKWTSLLNAAVINPRNTALDDTQASFVPMTLIGSAFNDKHQDEKRLWKEIKQGFTHFADGDIGVAKITPCFENSKACVFENLESGLGAGTTELHIVRPVKNTLNPRYVLAYLKSPRFLALGESKMTGTAGQKRLPKDFVESNPFPLPPLTEQHSIVAKVDELMALCDQIKLRITEAKKLQQKLADVMVESAVAS